MWRGHGENGALLYCWWECKLVQPLCKIVQRFLKNTKNRDTIYPAMPGYIAKEKHNLKGYKHPNVHLSTI